MVEALPQQPLSLNSLGGTLGGSAGYDALAALPELDELLSSLPARHPVLAKEVCEVMADRPLGAMRLRQGLAQAQLLPEEVQDELCLQIVEKEQRRRKEQGMDFKEDFRESLPLEDRRWKARVALQKAMHTRRLKELRAAIGESEASGLYAVELDYARNIMVEERKDVARIALKEALESRAISSLRSCIGEAIDADVLPHQIHGAEKVLEEEVEKEHARKALLTALKNGSLKFLQAAVERGEAAKLMPLELDRTKSALATQQRKANAREALALGVAIGDIKKLKAAIQEAKEAKLLPGESDAAKESLKKEVRKSDARHGCKDAEILRQGGDVETFRAALREAEEAGLDQAELAPMLQTLAMEDLKISARNNLEFARTKNAKISKERMLEITRTAVEEGEACGLTDAELGEARELLVEAKKADARVILHKAVETRDVEAIYAAIKHGESVGLSHLAFHEAHHTIHSEEIKHQVLDGMATALTGRKIFAMKTAIKDGMNVQLPEAEFTELRIALKEEERKAAARLGLQEAIQHGLERKFSHNEDVQHRMLEGLDDAIEEGDASGLSAEDVDPARAQVRDIRQHIAREALAHAVKMKSIEMLHAAIAVGKKMGLSEHDLEVPKATVAKEERRQHATAALKHAIASRDIDELKIAIREGDIAVMGSREHNDAKKVLKEEERRTEALEGLRDAIASRKIEKLSRWIGKSEGAGLQYLGGGSGVEELVTAKVVLVEEERKVSAREALKEAEKSRSIPQLRAARNEGVNANLEPHEVERANRTLAEVLPIAARAGLEKALAGRVIKELRVAIIEGEAVGLDASELNMPRLALGEEQLSEAVRKKAAFGIRRAIEDGERWGVDTLALEDARRVLAAEEKKELARKMLRDSETNRRVDEIMIAMSSGRAAGLQEWEFDFANKVVEEERRKLMARPMRSR